jgi:glycosyltransferase involved in cell wall biosynthesis
MSKTVTIDARWLIGGIGTYTENLVFGLAQTAHDFQIRAIVRSTDVHVLRKFCSQVEVVDVPIYTVREQMLVPRAAAGSDLLHIPHFNVPLLHRGPMVVSIMDLIHLRAPEYRGSLSSLLYARPMLKLAARKAAHVITVSQYSKNEIMDVLGIPASRITVIHCGVGENFRESAGHEQTQDTLKRLGLNRPYFLYVGNLKPHKNVKTLLQAFAYLRHEKRVPHSLLVVGSDVPRRRLILKECARLRIVDAVIFAPFLPAAELPSIYARADLLVLPSTMEGFGLPVIEAMACGTPVICSAASSLPEVAGDAAIFFDPHSSEQLACQIEHLLRSGSLRTLLRQKGLERAKRFTWREAARKHLEVYRNVLDVTADKETEPALTSCQGATP